MGRKKRAKEDKNPSKKQNSKPADSSEVAASSSPESDEHQKAMRRIVIYLSALAVILIFMGGYWLFVASKKSNLADECEAARIRGDWAALELKAREWATWEPDNDRPWMYAAAAAQEVGDQPRELEYLKNISDKAPIDALLRRGHLQFLANQIVEAIENNKILTKREPTLKEPHRRLNFLYAMTRQRNALITESRRAIESGADVPETYVYLVGADWITFTNGFQVNTLWAERYPDNNQIFEVASVLHLIASGAKQSMEMVDEKLKQELAKTGDQIDRLRKKYPANREVVIMELTFAVNHADARRVAEILNGLEYDIEDDSRYWRVRGWFYSFQENWEEAEKSYLKCLEMNPFDWQCRYGLAEVLRNLKKTDEVKPMQESAAMGKEIMRRVLQSESTIEIPKSTLELIAEYARNCGETGVADTLAERLNGTAE